MEKKRHTNMGKEKQNMLENEKWTNKQQQNGEEQSYRLNKPRPMKPSPERTLWREL